MAGLGGLGVPMNGGHCDGGAGLGELWGSLYGGGAGFGRPWGGVSMIWGSVRGAMEGPL